ncbi:unnamed protein product [Brassica oleracea]
MFQRCRRRYRSKSDRKKSARSVSLRSTPAKAAIRPRETDPVKRDHHQQTVNRCSGCRKKVGLTVFRCRCGDLFCAEHRYSDRHDCSYDYKIAGREAIARENPSTHRKGVSTWTHRRDTNNLIYIYRF